MINVVSDPFIHSARNLFCTGYGWMDGIKLTTAQQPAIHLLDR